MASDLFAGNKSSIFPVMMKGKEGPVRGAQYAFRFMLSNF